MARLRPSYLCCVDKSNETHFLRASRVCVTACRVVVSAQSSSRLSLTTWDNCWYWDDGCIPQGNRAINALLSMPAHVCCKGVTRVVLAVVAVVCTVFCLHHFCFAMSQKSIEFILNGSCFYALILFLNSVIFHSIVLVCIS